MPARLMGRFVARSRVICASVVLSALLAAAPCVCAAPEGGDTATAAEPVANTPYSASFIVNANAVFVRAGPAESYYPTMKLDKGTKVKAVGMKLDWLKIVPPDGAFCYISKAHVDRSGDGKVGHVNSDTVNVRAGSTMNAMKVQVLCQLSTGAEVKIVGEQDEYFKIEPPEGKAFLYVKKDFVDPDPNSAPEKQNVAANDNKQAPAPQQPKGEPAQPRPPMDIRKEVAKGNSVEPKKIEEADGKSPDAGATTQPSSTIAKGAATQPTDEAVAVEALFEKAEAQFAEANNKPVDQQPIAEMLKQYEQLVASDKLTNTLHRIAETRLSTLKVREQVATELAQAKAAQEALQKRQLALKAEGEELKERLSNTGVASYTAVGELQISSLQLGSKTLYRLTDPANERTICYIRTDDPKFATYISKFIGVKGDITTESRPAIKIITPTDVSSVDPAKVNHGVNATIMPPSMTAADDATAAAHVDTH